MSGDIRYEVEFTAFGRPNLFQGLKSEAEAQASADSAQAAYSATSIRIIKIEEFRTEVERKLDGAK